MEALPKFKTVDDYVDFYSDDLRSRLESLRKTIKKAAPKAEEVIAYNMPGYRQDGVVIYFCAFKKHISIFPRPAAFKKELAKYAGGKGTIQILHSEPLPLKLVTEMVKYRIIKNKEESDKKQPHTRK